jgi:hypothetical protein
MKANGSDSEHETAMLARLLPELAERDLPEGRHQILKEHLMNEFRLASADQPADGRLPDRPSPVRQRSRLRAVGLTAAVAVVVAAAAITGLRLSAGASRPAGTDGNAVRLLAKIAAVTAQQPGQAVRDNQFEYIKSEVAFEVTSVTVGQDGTQHVRSYLEKAHERQVWYSVSDLCKAGLVRENGQDSALDDTGPGSPRCPDRGSLNDPTYRLLQSLPASPRALLRMINVVERGHGPSPDAEAFTTIGDLLRESIVPPRVSAALYRAAALIPGVTVVPDATDAIGRHGVAVAFTSDGVRSEWIFNKRSLRLIGEREVTVRTGAVVGVSAIEVRAFVGHPGQIPPGR